jgi:hypothetical protein
MARLGEQRASSRPSSWNPYWLAACRVAAFEITPPRSHRNIRPLTEPVRGLSKRLSAVLTRTRSVQLLPTGFAPADTP